jgi:hypothetical protein
MGISLIGFVQNVTGCLSYAQNFTDEYFIRPPTRKDPSRNMFWGGGSQNNYHAIVMCIAACMTLLCFYMKACSTPNTGASQRTHSLNHASFLLYYTTAIVGYMFYLYISVIYNSGNNFSVNHTVDMLSSVSVVNYFKSDSINTPAKVLLATLCMCVLFINDLDAAYKMWIAIRIWRVVGPRGWVVYKNCTRVASIVLKVFQLICASFCYVRCAVVFNGLSKVGQFSTHLDRDLEIANALEFILQRMLLVCMVPIITLLNPFNAFMGFSREVFSKEKTGALKYFRLGAGGLGITHMMFEWMTGPKLPI